MRTALLPAGPWLLCTIAAAQCPFSPTIDPADPVLCPGESITLSTQAFESYQWFRDGQPIPGATGPTLQVDYLNDTGAGFTVRAEENGCQEMSDVVLVDGWVFLPPFVMHEGDDPISVGPFGEPTYCEGALVQLTLGMPYIENIIWTNNGVAIPGATQPTLVVTAPGSYSVSSAPAVCPDAVTGLGLTIDIGFMEPVQPQIMAMDEQLCAGPPGEFYQWYLNGDAILNSNSACISADVAGSYTVYVDYDHGCQVMSEPYLSTGIAEQGAVKPWALYPNPSTGLITVVWDGHFPVGTYWSVTDRTGHEVRSGFMPGDPPLQVDLSGLAGGTYLFQAAHHRKALGPATRFTLVH